MLRIGQVEATATQDGKYTDGSVAGGIAATRLRAAAFNAMQEELAHIVESAGLALDINDMTQVLKAIQKLTLSRANPFADIKSDGAAAISTALTNLHLEETVKLAANEILNPPLTHEELIQVAEIERQRRINATNDFMNSRQWPGKAAIGRLKGDELAQYNLWLDYLDALEAVDTSSAPDIKWLTPPGEKAS